MNLTPFLIAGLSTGGIYVLSGVGLVVLYRASGVLNFAQGAIGAFVALIGWSLIDAGYPVWAGWAAGVAAAMAISLAYGRFVASRLAAAEPTVRAMGTLGLALILLGVAEFIWGEWPRSLRLPIDTMAVTVAGVRVTYTRLLALALALVATGGVMAFLNGSRLGLSMRALANDREISALVGVPVLKVDAWAWTLSGALAGISGLMLADLVRLQASLLTFMVVPAMAAALVGNLRSFPLVVVGGLAIGALEALATPFAAIAPYRSAAPFLVAVLALVALQRGARAGGRLDQALAVRATFAPTRSGRAELVIGLALAAALAAFAPALVSSFWLKSLTSVVILALASLSVTLLYAQVGIVSLCQYALVGVGGWVSLRLAHATSMPFLLSLWIGSLAAAAFGVIAGLPALRLRGLYVALVTLMIAGALQIVFTVWGFPDGGPGFFGRVVNGEQIPAARPEFATSDAAYFRLAVAVAALGFLLAQAHKLTRPGRAWALIRRGEAAAAALGVDSVGYKIWAFALAGALAGAAGGLLGGSVGILDAGAFPALDSLLLFALSIVAGAYHWSGPIFVGLLMRGVPNLLLDLGVDGNIATAIYGAGLLHSLVNAPQGVSGDAVALARWLSRRLRLRGAKTEAAT